MLLCLGVKKFKTIDNTVSHRSEYIPHSLVNITIFFLLRYDLSLWTTQNPGYVKKFARVKVMECLSMSPDINEHLWGILKLKVEEHKVSDIHQLRDVVMEEWKRTQWQPVKLWWTSCPRELRQCWKLMVATQNIESFGPIWTFSLRGVLTFVASGLDINGCALSYFEETVNVHCYISCTLTTLHCRKVLFLQCCHMKSEACTYFCEILYD